MEAVINQIVQEGESQQPPLKKIQSPGGALETWPPQVQKSRDRGQATTARSQSTQQNSFRSNKNQMLNQNMKDSIYIKIVSLQLKKVMHTKDAHTGIFSHWLLILYQTYMVMGTFFRILLSSQFSVYRKFF